MLTWRPIDFEGIISFDKTVIEQLKTYLEEKESQLAHAILESIPASPDPKAVPILPRSLTHVLRLSDAIESSYKKIRQMAMVKDKPATVNAWEHAAKIINQSLWDYVEALESCSVELFQQLDQVSIDHWRGRLSVVIDEIKVLLIHRIDDVSWAIKRLEEQLHEWRDLSSHKQGLKFLVAAPLAILDKELLDNLEKTKEYLSTRYHQFSHKFREFNKLRSEIEKMTHKIDAFHVLSVLEPPSKEQYRRLYQLLHLWSMNKASKSLPLDETVYAVRTVTSFERALMTFKDYYNMLKLVLFERSRNLKNNPPEIFEDQTGKGILLEVIKGFQEENETLGEVVAKYREFLLDNDPAVKHRPFWKFWKWAKDEEPVWPHKLKGLLEDIQTLDNYFTALRKGVEKGPHGVKNSAVIEQMAEIDKCLHEMGQPLASKEMLRYHGTKVIGLLKLLDEIGSYNQNVVEFTGASLSKAMRVDWKYQTLFDIPEFYEVYAIHQGISYLFEDRNHTKRLNKFKRLVQQIDEWIKQRSFQKHIHEIEVDMSDIKGYLQDFLGHVQRFSKEPIVDAMEYDQQYRELYRQLLEYRYLFGSFFHELDDGNMEERNIRNHFLFVDQYFETIDNKLKEIKAF